MTGIGAYLAYIGIGIGVKVVADLAVRGSKLTSNHIDDAIADAFKSAVSGFNLFRKK